jgi:hypothetical protein
MSILRKETGHYSDRDIDQEENIELSFFHGIGHITADNRYANVQTVDRDGGKSAGYCQFSK